VSQESGRTQTESGVLKDQSLPSVVPLAPKQPLLSQGAGRNQSAPEERRQRVTESPGFTTGRSVQESSSEDAQEIEPSKVIDWLLEKRSEKKE